MQNNGFTQLYITNLDIFPANMFQILGTHHSCHTGITHLYRYPILQNISDLIHNSTIDIDEVDPKMIRMYPMLLSIGHRYHILECLECDRISNKPYSYLIIAYTDRLFFRKCYLAEILRILLFLVDQRWHCYFVHEYLWRLS